MVDSLQLLDHRPVVGGHCVPLGHDARVVAEPCTGFVLADFNFKPIYANDAAIQILIYPIPFGRTEVIQRRLRAILGVERYAPAVTGPESFLSGDRHYVCRLFPLETFRGNGHGPTVALLVEREDREPFNWLSARTRFHLSPRECETAQHLMHGLTTKAIAERMNISPHTVKQFIRQIMGKVGVTTRCGIVGKILSKEPHRARAGLSTHR